MKKNIVLFVLFVLPIVAYLFFASGVNSFTKLPTLTKSVNELNFFESLDSQKVVLKDQISILGFGGSDLFANRENIFNLNMKVYKRYHEFKKLQFVYLCPIGTEKDAEKILVSLKSIVPVTEWKFIFATPDQITSFHKSLQLKKDKLNENFGTPNVYLIDKELNLRGRKVANEKEYNEGYSTFHPSELSNVMLDDFKILLYEYRAALKKNKNAERRI